MRSTFFHAAARTLARTNSPHSLMGAIAHGKGKTGKGIGVFGLVAGIAAAFIATGTATAQCDPAWTLRSSDGPSAREDAMMAFDTVRQRVVLFGGGDFSTGTRLNDTWEWDGTAWSQRFPAGTLPLPRAGGGAAFDSSRGRLVIFGGNAVNNTTNYGDTWEWNGVTWMLAATTGPSQRYSPGVAFDRARNVVVLVSGQNGTNPPFRDTWHWNGQWTRASTVGPSGRYAPRLAFDSLRAVSVFFGGTATFGNAQAFDDTWEWNGAVWTQRTSALVPPARRFHAMAFDPTRAATVMFGGDSTNSVFRADTWLWSGSEWAQLAITGPSARRLAAMAYDEARGEIVLFGGFDTAVRRDTWVLPSALGVIRSPQTVLSCPSGDVDFAVHAVGIGSLSYSWRKDSTPINTIANPSAATATLTLMSVQLSDSGVYDCIVTNSCGSVTSDPATLTICPADFNCDGFVNSQDFFDFLATFFSLQPAADFNHDTFINSQDFFDFLGAFFGGGAGC